MTSERAWACDECGAVNSGRRCEICGQPRPLAAQGRRDHAEPTPAALGCALCGRKGHDERWHCAWTTAGARCLLAGEHTTDAAPLNGARDRRRWYCAWHGAVLRDPRLAGDYDQFEAFCAWSRRRYCSQVSHHPAAELWELVQGRQVPLSAPTPCALARCWWAHTEPRR